MTYNAYPLGHLSNVAAMGATPEKVLPKGGTWWVAQSPNTHYIRKLWGQVVVSLSASNRSQGLKHFCIDQQFALNKEMREAPRRKHGALFNEHTKEKYRYCIDSLTQGEARHSRKAVSIDAIRDRISAASLKRGDSAVDGVTSTAHLGIFLWAQNSGFEFQ